MAKIIKVTGVPNKKGLCQVRPKLDGSQGNPMKFCSYEENHKGKHSWEKK